MFNSVHNTFRHSWDLGLEYVVPRLLVHGGVVWPMTAQRDMMLQPCYLDSASSMLNANPGLHSAKNEEAGEAPAWLMLNWGPAKEETKERRVVLVWWVMDLFLARFLATTCLTPQLQHKADRLGWLACSPGCFTTQTFKELTGRRIEPQTRALVWV